MSCICVVYDVVDDSLAAICQARLCPQFRWQSKCGVLVMLVFICQEASSLIGRLTFGRCTVAVGFNGGIRLPVVLHVIDVMLDHVFCLRTCNDCIQEECILPCGKHVQVSAPPGHSVFFRKHTITQARHAIGPWRLIGLFIAVAQVR